MIDLHMPKRVYLEASERDACDVLVEMEGGTLYTATFVTIAYLHRQMDLTFEMSKHLNDVPLVRYAALETAHILVEDIARDTIEDTIDNLLALDVFEGFFTQVTEEQAEDGRTTNNGNGKRATSEVAAVVISDVLSVEGD